MKKSHIIFYGGLLLIGLSLNQISKHYNLNNKLIFNKIYVEANVGLDFKYLTKAIDSLIYERVLIAQQYQESKFNPRARSYVGALGVSQFTSSTWDWAKKKEWIPRNASRTNPHHSIQAQHKYMEFLLNQSYINGDLIKALAAYNCGQGRLEKIIKYHGNSWQNHIPTETKKYISRIEQWYNDSTLSSPFQSTPPLLVEFKNIKK